jgi:hypothetical protein
MHKQFTATRDIKFPDSKQYMKYGDMLLYDEAHRSMSIYRNSNLIGTVPFSNSGLREFVKLGWIIDASIGVKQKATELAKAAKASKVVEPKKAEAPKEPESLEDEELPQKGKKSRKASEMGSGTLAES